MEYLTYEINLITITAIEPAEVYKLLSKSIKPLNFGTSMNGSINYRNYAFHFDGIEVSFEAVEDFYNRLNKYFSGKYYELTLTERRSKRTLLRGIEKT